MLGPISTSGDGAPGAVTGSGTAGQIAQWATATSLGSLALVPIALGGTNSSTALSNNRVMISSGGKVVENAALLSGNVVFANASGLPDGTTDFKWTALTNTLTANGAILAGGTTGATPASGAGTRFMWIPAKAAMRAGSVTGTQWDDAQIGTRSFAFGLNPRAEATGAVAWGEDIRVTGTNTWGISLDNGGYTISASNVMSILGGRFSIGGTNPQSGLEVAKNMSWIRVAVSTDITIGVNDNAIIYGVSTAAARIITLPDASDAGAGRIYIIKDESGTGAGTNNITINAAGGDTIDGAASYVMSVNRQAIGLYSNGGVNWGVF